MPANSRAKTLKHLLIPASILISAASCKMNNGSKLKTLDNFTNITRRDNFCVADPKKAIDPKDHPLIARVNPLGESGVELDVPLLGLVRNAVVNIPVEIQNAFVASSGQIVIMDSASEACKEVAKAINPDISRATDLDQMSSCLVTIPATNKNGEILHAVFPPQIKSVHHNMMRVFGSFIVDILPLKLPRTSDAVQSAVNQSARDLIADLASSNLMSLDAMSSFFSAKDLDTLKQRVTKNSNISAQELFAGLDAGKDSSLWQFKKMAFIESFDSYYCNQWSDEKAGIVQAVIAKQKPLSALNEVNNTRYVMSKLYTTTYQGFSPKMQDILNSIRGNSAKTGSGNISGGGFSLGGPSANSTRQDPESPAWSGTKAFFGSLWSNTGGAASNAYSSYSNRVEKEINKAVDSGSSLSGALAQGTINGISNTYREDVAKPIAQRTEQVFDQQIKGGATIDQAYRNTLTVELLRPTGATAIAETTAVGQRFDGSQYKDTTERASEFFGGVGSLAGTTASVVSFVPGVGNRVVGGGKLPESPGVLPNAAEVADNAAKARSLGVPAGNAAEVGAAFESGANVTVIPKGTPLYRTGNNIGKWMTKEPIKDPINSLALPTSSEKTANTLTKYVTTKDIKVLEGGVAPQPTMVSPGNPKLGGSGQIYIPKEQLVEGVRKAGDSAIMGGAAGAGSAINQK